MKMKMKSLNPFVIRSLFPTDDDVINSNPELASQSLRNQVFVSHAGFGVSTLQKITVSIPS